MYLLAVGEILWDMLPGGKQLGGAPGNFACHAKALGASSDMISRVGDDALGREVLDRVRGMGLATEMIEVDADLPTGTVTVALAADGQPQFTIHENSAWDRIEATPRCLAAASRCDAICFGTLAQRAERSRQAIEEVIAATPREALRVLDINLRAPFFSRVVIERSLAMANALKLNEQELPVLAEMFGLCRGDARGQLAELAKLYSLRLVALTRGAQGSVLWAHGQAVEHPGVAVQVVDAVGAGDAFTAAMTVGFLRNDDLDAVNRSANRIAAWVCTQNGATPALPAELRLAMNRLHHD